MIARWVANLLIVAALAAAGWWQYQQTSQAERALCALRADVEARVANAERYLADVKAGRREPIRGITVADIKRSLRDQRRTIDSLMILDCKETQK